MRIERNSTQTRRVNTNTKRQAYKITYKRLDIGAQEYIQTLRHRRARVQAKT